MIGPSRSEGSRGSAKEKQGPEMRSGKTSGRKSGARSEKWSRRKTGGVTNLLARNPSRKQQGGLWGVGWWGGGVCGWVVGGFGGGKGEGLA